MPTKSELEGRASRIVQVFQKAMPTISTPYPSITVATQRTYRNQRGFLVYKTGSTAIAAPTDDQAVELINGTKGAALLVRKEEVPSLDSFYHLLWAALGRFYIGATPPSAVAAMQNITPEDGSVVVGTAFWSVFAPEAIANRVERFLRNASSKGEAGDAAGGMAWKEEEWRSVYEGMKVTLLSSYGQRNIQIPDLAMLLSAALTDDLLRDMIHQGKEGKLPGREGRPFDPTGIDTMPEQLRPSMKGLIATLEGQMEKERYWEASEETLCRIGELLGALNGEYVRLIADQIALDELDAVEIPKVLPEDLSDDLPEID
ncbi:MAG: hypothetical protein IKH57_21110 [Clostridia bacterium]|nr:hypothetical protein [Clostridia bacterium]